MSYFTENKLFIINSVLMVGLIAVASHLQKHDLGVETQTPAKNVAAQTHTSDVSWEQAPNPASAETPAPSVTQTTASAHTSTTTKPVSTPRPIQRERYGDDD